MARHFLPYTGLEPAHRRASRSPCSCVLRLPLRTCTAAGANLAPGSRTPSPSYSKFLFSSSYITLQRQRSQAEPLSSAPRVPRSSAWHTPPARSSPACHGANTDYAVKQQHHRQCLQTSEAIAFPQFAAVLPRARYTCAIRALQQPSTV